VLVVPENFSDFYSYPAAALNEIRRVLSVSLPVRIEAPSKVSLFAYDNGTFIVENFRDQPVEVTAVRGTGANAQRIAVSLPAHAWRAFGADGNPL
jgi:hypothetical protein